MPRVKTLKVIFKNEVFSVLKNKRYVATLLLQLIFLSALIPIFANVLKGGELKIATSGMQEFIPVYVIDESKNASILKKHLENEKILEVEYTKESYAKIAEKIKKNIIPGMIYIPPTYDESRHFGNYEILLVIDVSNMKQDALYDAVLEAVNGASTEIAEIRKRKIGIKNDFKIKLDRILLREEIIKKVKENKNINSKFSEFFMSYLIPLMLFFPIFTVGSAVLDSVVGEKEKKTVEAILASPISSQEFIYGKFLAFSLLVIFQLFLWLGILMAYGVEINALPEIVLLIIAINSFILAIAILLCIYSSSVKEGNILMMLLYTFFFIILIISLTSAYFNPEIVLTPLSAVSILVSGGKIALKWYFLMVLLLFAFSFSALKLASVFFERDDITFGPKPRIEELLRDFALWLYSGSFKRSFMRNLALAFIFNIFAFISAFLLEASIAILFLFSGISILLILPFAAAIEEILKQINLILISERLEKNIREGAFIGMLNGASFFFIETAFAALAGYAIMPGIVLRVIKLRFYTTSFLHVITSLIFGAGIMSGDSRKALSAFAIATLMHLAFNLRVLGIW